MRGLRCLNLLACPNFRDLLLPCGPSRDIPYRSLSVLLYPDVEEWAPFCRGRGGRMPVRCDSALSVVSPKIGARADGFGGTL